jgi:hypothetical protein
MIQGSLPKKVKRTEKIQTGAIILPFRKSILKPHLVLQP